MLIRTRVIDDAMAYAARLGVKFHAEWADKHITFIIKRGNAPKGSGAQAITHLLKLADEADLPVAIDVLESIPDLIRYYWRFGFRIYDGSAKGEITELAKICAERDRFLNKPGRTPDDFGVAFMWRDRHAGPLNPQ